MPRSTGAVGVRRWLGEVCVCVVGGRLAGIASPFLRRLNSAHALGVLTCHVVECGWHLSADNVDPDLEASGCGSASSASNRFCRLWNHAPAGLSAILADAAGCRAGPGPLRACAHRRLATARTGVLSSRPSVRRVSEGAGKVSVCQFTLP